ncbi:MAG: hypothetical protein QG562_43 [Patescibacteria group bacterium]|nr:hypothetical protein [Patescibacteria group bacterium]
MRDLKAKNKFLLFNVSTDMFHNKKHIFISSIHRLKKDSFYMEIAIL